MTWQLGPTSLPLKANFNHFLYVDESGTPTLKPIFKVINENLDPNTLGINGRYLCLTGTIVSHNEHINLTTQFRRIKEKYWPPDGNNLNKKVCFHGADIANEKNPFDANSINITNFKNDLSNTLNTTHFQIISCLLDKYDFVKQYQNPYRAYDYLTECLIEKYILYLEKRDTTGIIVFESRGKKEDFLLHHFILALFQNGTHYVTRSRLNKRISGIYFNTKRTSCNTRTHCGLELTDLCIAPIKFALINKKSTQIFDSQHYLFPIIKQKTIGFPDQTNYGLKILP